MRFKCYDGNVLDSTAPIIAHQVNFNGIMDAGVAKCIKEKYPDIMEDYLEWCNSQEDKIVLLGQVQFYKRGEDDKGNPLCIANCFSQRNKKGLNNCYTDYKAVSWCMREINTNIRKYNLEHRVALPYKYGCGIGEGNWKDVLECIFWGFSREKDKDFIVELWNINGFTKEEKEEIPEGNVFYRYPFEDKAVN